MELMELLKPEIIITDIKSSRKGEVLQHMLDHIKNDYNQDDVMQIFEAVMERESMGSTAIGRGIALPHVRNDIVKKHSLIIAFSRSGFDFDSIDHQKTHIVFLFLQPDEAGIWHLKCFSQLSTVFLNPAALKELMQTQSKEEIVQVLKKLLKKASHN